MLPRAGWFSSARYDKHMLTMLRALFAHQAWADAALLTAVRKHAPAAEDETLRKTLHHILMVQRYFLSLFVQAPFDSEIEMRIPASLDDFERRFRETHEGEIAFAGRVEEAELVRILEFPRFMGVRPSLADGMLQVVMHSQHHRGQCAARLRALGGSPPTMDYIIWTKDRPAPAWP